MFFKTKKWLVLCLSSQWILGLLVPLPLISSQYSNRVESWWMSIYQIMINVFIPALVSFVFNTLIFMHVHSSTRRVRCFPEGEHHRSAVRISRRDLYLLRNMIYTFAVYVGGCGPIFLLIAIDFQGTVTAVVYVILAIVAEASLFSIIINLFRCNKKIRTLLEDKYYRMAQTLSYCKNYLAEILLME
ncbi:unnamed protein product [Adineta ricciae]|uniref:G-protein coupled receptors family 1 profile domain-containing protein n=1 Tax=Adineta ricciae TaxID=249248 RepID=A0A815GE10_ADIRI|nr:unnamed protein product [Adineta ricciae]